MDWKALVAARARAAGSPSSILAFGRRVEGPRGVSGQERGPPIRSAAHGPMQQPPSQWLTASKGTADGGSRGRSGAKAAHFLHFFQTAVGHRAENEIHAGGGTEVDCWSAGSGGRLAARMAVRHSVA